MHKTVEVFSIRPLRRRGSIVVIIGGGPHLALMPRRLHQSGQPVKLVIWKDMWVHVALASWIYGEVSDSDVSLIPGLQVHDQGAPARATAATVNLRASHGRDQGLKQVHWSRNKNGKRARTTDWVLFVSIPRSEVSSRI